ncbi:MAG: DEAD/DEAH box helicase [Thermoleophilia bacterium]|nr:DEAD/DEAH box helicase [Thermoleophilia bacterium]
MSARIADVLAGRSITAPFQVQTRVLPDALAGRDVLAKSPTGSGKTLAFALPIVERLHPEDGPVSALVLVPTRELCVQVAEELASLGPARGLRTASVYGGVPIKGQAERARKAHVLVATPGRLEDLVARRAVSLDRVRVLVLDEADRMLDMGFKPQVDRIVARLPRTRQTMLFSATLDGEVGVMAAAYTRGAASHEAELPSARERGDVEHLFVPVTADNKVEKLVELLTAERGLALVFVRTKHGADRLVRKLDRHGVRAVSMHGDKTQAAREKALASFESGKVSTLVATDVAARGLDLDEITHVINFDPPAEGKDYVHRVGRTGRAGRDGTGITLVLPDQQADVSRVAARLGHAEQFAREGMAIAPPRVVYSSRRRGSKWGPTRPRRKI